MPGEGQAQLPAAESLAHGESSEARIAPGVPVVAEVYWNEVKQGFGFSFHANHPGMEGWQLVLEGFSKKLLTLDEILLELAVAKPSFEIRRLSIDRPARSKQLALDAGIWVAHNRSIGLEHKLGLEKTRIQRLDDFVIGSIPSREGSERRIAFFLKQREFARAYELSKEMHSCAEAYESLKKRESCSTTLKRRWGEQRFETVFDAKGELVSYSSSQTKIENGAARTIRASEFHLKKTMSPPFPNFTVEEGHIHQEKSKSDASILGIKLDFRTGEPVVNSIVPTSAAFQGGLRLGDVLLELNGKPVVREKLVEITRGDNVKIEFRTGTENPKEIVAAKLKITSDETTLWLASQPPLIFEDN